MDVVTHPTAGLFPLAKDIQLDCDCPDWADMCKHIAAVLYGVGARLDEKPELLFLLRGVDHTSLISDIDLGLIQDQGKQSKRPQLKGNLTDIFGIEMEQSDQETVSKKIVRKKTAPKKIVRKKAVAKKTAAKKTVHKKISSKQVKQKTITAGITAGITDGITTGKNIARLRQRLGMNYAQFARLIGVSSATVSNWEKKRGQLNLHKQNNLALISIENLSRKQAWEQLDNNK